MQETEVQSLGWEDSLEKEMSIHSRTLAWRIPRTEEPGESHGQRSLAVSSPWGHKESDTTERLTNCQAMEANVSNISYSLWTINFRRSGGFSSELRVQFWEDGQNGSDWASLVVQWIRICLPMQETQV